MVVVRRLRSLWLLVTAGSLPLCVLAACGDDGGASPSVPPAGDASIERVRAAPSPGPPPDAAPAAPTPIADASCTVLVDSPALVPGSHVPEGTPITYASNPPSSGAHYPIWADFREFAAPVPDGYLVHSMEHGAVVLFYKCEALDAATGDCDSSIGALRAVRDAVATDPMCDPSIRVRVIVAPRPALDVPIAAAAWGHTYRAECVDAPSLAAFVRDHYAKAPEDFCTPGATTF